MYCKFILYYTYMFNVCTEYMRIRYNRYLLVYAIPHIQRIMQACNSMQDAYINELNEYEVKL